MSTIILVNHNYRSNYKLLSNITIGLANHTYLSNSTTIETTRTIIDITNTTTNQKQSQQHQQSIPSYISNNSFQDIMNWLLIKQDDNFFA
jgi:hypothetical protein